VLYEKRTANSTGKRSIDDIGTDLPAGFDLKDAGFLIVTPKSEP
jgi:hypothetical protein